MKRQANIAQRRCEGAIAWLAGEPIQVVCKLSDMCLNLLDADSSLIIHTGEVFKG